MKRVTRDQLCTSFSAAHAPVLQVQLGEPFVMETNDRFATYEGPTSSPEALEVLKTMAGPVYIEGAKPGDTLKIEVLDVTLPLDYGWIGATSRPWPAGHADPSIPQSPGAAHFGRGSLQRACHPAVAPDAGTHWCGPPGRE